MLISLRSRFSARKEHLLHRPAPRASGAFPAVDDPANDVGKLIAKYKPMRLKNNKGEWLKENEPGTKPNVYYIRNFRGEAHST